MKKFVSAILVILLIISSLHIGAFSTIVEAAGNDIIIWGGLDKAQGSGSFTKGDGSADNPYIIENGNQLYLMVYNFGTADKKLNGTAAYYKLGCDIYLNDISNYDSWGKAGFDMSTLNNWAKFEDSFCHRTFYGNFNGDGHTIYGLYAHSYRVASFLPNVGHGAVIRNVNFKNSYVVNTSNVNASDQEDYGDTVGQKVWYSGVYGSAGVLLSRADAAGDNDYNTVDYTVNNCSITNAYVQAKYFTAAFVAAANSCQPYIANCMTANITLDSTSTTQGVVGAIMNMAYGSTNPTCNMENILAVGYPIYGAGRDEMWSGLKKPTMSHTYTFKNVYSTVSNKYAFNHSSYGNVSFTDSEVKVIDAAKLIGTEVENNIPGFDWVYTWRAVDGDYPIPLREYVVPSGEEYYKNGGPKYSTDKWNGTVSTHFAAGNGTVEDPYLISNCEEFYRMITMPQDNSYYKIADGVTDLYFNDVEGKNYSTLMTYFSWGIGENYAYDENVCFNGSFDGNGVNIYGVYSKSNNYVGLFAQVGNATLRNFTIKYSYFKTSQNSAKGAAAVVGAVKEKGTAYLQNIAVVDTDIDGKTVAAGFVGYGDNMAAINIKNSIFAGKVTARAATPYHSGFIAEGNDCNAIIQNSISVGEYPLSESVVNYSSKHSGVYTNITLSSENIAAMADGIKTVDTQELYGESAKITCSEFDWKYSWNITETLPMPSMVSFNNGIPGQAWTGEIAASFAGGNGTANNPYQINTAEMLARMLTYGNVGEYYKLTADIYINDISRQNWQNTAIEWFTSKDITAFKGNFNGSGYTVRGMYANIKQQNEYAALIPILGSGAQISKLTVDNAYLVGENGTYLGGIAGVVEDNASLALQINACTVGSNVCFEGGANIGGILASVGYAALSVEECVFNGSINANGNKYGVVCDVIGNLDIKDCICCNIAAFDTNIKINAKNIYTNIPINCNGITVLTIDQMMGTNARINMTQLNFSSSWRVLTDGLPVPTGNIRYYNGVMGEIWSGKTAYSFAGGNGSQGNPYRIETGEQLALAMSTRFSNTIMYFELGCDIYLNDVSSQLWKDKVGLRNWLNNSSSGLFTGTFNGNGYVVYGMCHYYENDPSNLYVGLFPRIGGSATVKNIGVSEAYIKIPTNDESVYAGGLFGMGSAFYDFYGQKTGIDATVNDEFLVPGAATPTKLPSFTNCFVDHTCYIESGGAGGIGCPGGAAVVVRDCYVTATVKGAKDSREGGLLGPMWNNCSRVYNSFAFTQNDIKSLSGNQQWVNNESNMCIYTENVYYYGSKHIVGTTRINRHTWRIDEAAKEAMPYFDWQNTWNVESGGTPVLCVFDKADRAASLFSDKNFKLPDSKISFETGVEGLTVEEITGQPYDMVELPIPKRQGYKFVAWHAFEDLTLEYPYDYFLPRDITLYAKWQKVSITQDFEDYPFTKWDCDSNIWNYNCPENDNEYNSDFVHSGNNSIKLKARNSDVATILLNYAKTLTTGQEYTISLWIACDGEEVNPQIALSHKVYPDYLAAERLTEPIVEPGETVGKWTNYAYKFKALTPWVALKVLCNDGVYIDDIVIDTSGELINEVLINDDVYEGEYYSNTFEKISISNKVSKIDNFAFAYSDFVTDVFIGGNVVSIGEYAFYDCARLNDVWYAGTEQEFNEISIAKHNTALQEAALHFNSCEIGITHSFDAVCDAVCNICGCERSVEHIYDGPLDMQCNVCGDIRDAIAEGDVNGDTYVNNKDLAIMMQFINDWDVVINITAADINGDSIVNNKDYALLMRHINKWNN